MTQQSEALRLAEWIESDMSCDGDAEIAAELRRLSAENEALRRERDEARRTVREAHEAGTRLTTQRDALLEALSAMLEQFNYNTITGIVHDESAAIVKARAAIKAVEESK